MNVQPHHLRRAQQVQRLQIVRRHRIGNLLVQIRLKQNGIKTRKKQFRQILSTVSALRQTQAPTVSSGLTQRISQAAIGAHRGIVEADHQERQLMVRGHRLRQLLTLVDRAQERGAEMEIQVHRATARLRDSLVLSESQADEISGTPSLVMNPPTPGRSDPTPHSLPANPDIRCLPTPLNGTELSIPCGVHRVSSVPSEAEARRIVPPPIPRGVPAAVAETEVAIAAELPRSAGSVEITHSASQGVSVRMSTPSKGTLESLRHSCQVIGNALRAGRIRMNKIDLIQEDR